MPLSSITYKKKRLHKYEFTKLKYNYNISFIDFHVVLTIFGKMKNVKSVCQDILERTVLNGVYTLTMVKDVRIRVTVTSQIVTMNMDVKEIIHRMGPLQL